MSFLPPDETAAPAPRSQPSRRRAPDSSRRTIAVDRVLCTGHGVCGQTLPGAVRLDPWGYPVVLDPVVDRLDADVAIRLCPARALFVQETRRP